MGFTFDKLVHPCRVTSPRRMSDDETPSSNPARSQLKDPRVLEDLVRVGLKKTSSPEDAEDLVGDAILRLLEDSPWRKWTFLSRMTYLMRHVRGPNARHRRVPDDGGLPQPERARDGIHR
jgi:DNA-directed RNA polymerase specialized sigma24 family protein